MSTIFISHSSADNDLAKELETRLEQENHSSVFLDLDPEKGIVAGRSWEQTLYRKLRACRVVVAICTDSYIKSQWCFAEIALARMEAKPIIVMLADPLASDPKLPSILTGTQFIDFKANPEDGYRRLWRSLKDLDVLGSVGDWNPKESPYLGLSAYHEEHAPVFFGREAEVRAGIELLDRGAPGLITVLGASGSGKSSLVRAGIVPRLRRRPKDWIVVDAFRPGRDPFAELAQALSVGVRRYAPDASEGALQPASIERRLERWVNRPTGQKAEHPHRAPKDEEPNRETRAEEDERLGKLLTRLEELRQEPPAPANSSLLDFLDWSLEDLRRICNLQPPQKRGRDDTTPLVDIAEQLQRNSGQTDARVLLVIDQFEELLGQEEDAAAAKRFLDLLAASLAVEKTPLTILVTMRSDFLESFQKANADLKIDFESLSLGPMSEAGMRQVIEAPAKLGAIQLETGFADELLKDASSPDALPLMSFTLWLLWRNCKQAGVITLNAYTALGGLEGAIAGEADAILRRARTKDQEAALRTAFTQLVRIDEDGRFARQPAAWESPKLTPVHDLLDSFVDKRLLVLRAEGGSRIVEVAHESLFRAWEPLRKWSEEHRADLMLKRQLRQNAEAWDHAGRPADYLWRGARLEQAVDLVRRGDIEGGKKTVRISRDFVDTSEAMRKRQSRRRRNIVVSVTAVLVGFLIYALIMEHEARKAERASWARRQALAAIDLIETDPIESIAVARAAMCVTYTYDGFVLDEAHSALNRAVQAAQRQSILKGHASAVTDVRFLPGGMSLAQGDGSVQRMISLGRDRSVLMWDVPGGDGSGCNAPPRSGTMANAIRRIAVDPTGGIVAAAAAGGIVEVYDTSDSAAPPSLSGDLRQFADVTAMAIAPDGGRIAVAGRDGSVLISSVPSVSEPLPTVTLPGGNNRVSAMNFDSDATRLAVAAWDGTVTVWNSTSGVPVYRLDAHSEAVTEVAIQDGLLASAGWDEAVRIWDLASGALLHSFEHDATVSALAFVPDAGGAGVLASASWDRTVRLWDVESGAPIHRLDHSAEIMALAVGPTAAPPDGSRDNTARIATGSADGRVVVWAFPDGLRNAPTQGLVAVHLEQVNDLSFNSDGTRLASASDDNTIKVSTFVNQARAYDWQNSLDVGSYGLQGERDEWIAMITAGSVQVLNTERGRVRNLISDFAGNAQAIAFSPGDTSKLAVQADEVFEYYLEHQDLLMCADAMTGRDTDAVMDTYSIDDRCAEIGRDPDFESIWNIARSLPDKVRQIAR